MKMTKAHKVTKTKTEDVKIKKVINFNKYYNSIQIIVK